MKGWHRAERVNRCKGRKDRVVYVANRRKGMWWGEKGNGEESEGR